MTAVASGLDQMTLDLTEEIRVQAPIEKTFAALLEELGPANLGYQDAPISSTSAANALSIGAFTRISSVRSSVN